MPAAWRSRAARFASSNAASAGARKIFRAPRARSLARSGTTKISDLLDYRAFENIDVLQASGVGGGSLVYFNVHIRTPPEIFEDPRWPKGVKRDILNPFYDKARDMLEARQLTPPADLAVPQRTEAFIAAAQNAGRKPELMEICVYTGPEKKIAQGIVQDGCVYCGNCMLGCHVHAKNTLDLNYIPLAEQNGAEVFPLHQVEKIEPIEPVETNGYRVHFRRFDLEKAETQPLTLDGNRFDRRARPEPESQPGSVVGRKVIISAGSLGSTENSAALRDLHRTLTKLSPALGKSFPATAIFFWPGRSKRIAKSTPAPVPASPRPSTPRPQTTES